jgi:hypothetical protein
MLSDRRNVGENSCNSGDGTDQTGPILDVYDDDDDDDKCIRKDREGSGRVQTWRIFPAYHKRIITQYPDTR